MTRLLAVYDGSNNLLMRFEYSDARMPFAMTMGGAVYYLAYDQVGSLRVVADGSGNPVKRIDYDSFGYIITETDPTMKIPFGFAGGLHDRDTGLVRFGYRDYDPDTGRWTAKDPIGFAGGDSDLYGYCVNDPVNWVDTWGLETIYEGEASVYARKFEGQLTRTEEKFTHDGMTAAMRKEMLPDSKLNSEVIVECIDKRCQQPNNKICVRVNDRGPFVKGRIIDLTEKGFKELAGPDSLKYGHIRVRVTVP